MVSNKGEKCMYSLHFDDGFGRFRFIWKDVYFSSWTHLAFSLSS